MAGCVVCCALLASSSSSLNSNCSICQSSFSDLRPELHPLAWQSAASAVLDLFRLAKPVARPCEEARRFSKEVLRVGVTISVFNAWGVSVSRFGRIARCVICAQYAKNFLVRKEKTNEKRKTSQKACRRKTFAAHTASCGACVRTGRRQSIPSSNIESCAGVSDTVPFAACRPDKSPRSNLFAKRHSPSPSNHRTLIKSPAISAEDVQLT